MAVIRIWPKGGVTAGDDDKAILRRRRILGYQVDNPNTSEDEILGHPSVPPRFFPHPANLSLLVVKRDLVQFHDNPWFGDIILEYSSDYRPPDEAEPNPILRAPKIVWDSEIVQRAVTVDQDGNTIITASKETYDPPPTQPARILVLDYTHNLQIYDDIANRYAQYVDHLNETEWFSFKPDCAYIANLRWEYASEAGIDYIIENWIIKIDNQTLNDGLGSDPEEAGFRGVGWNLRPLHRGFWQIVAGPARRLILDAAGRQPPEPSLLDADGAVLALGGTPVFKNHRIFPRAEFNDLNLFP